MAEYFFIAATSLMEEFSLESPSDGLPSMHCYEISLDARVQLYSLLTSRPLDECYENETPLPISEAANSMYYQLDTNLVYQLSQYHLIHALFSQRHFSLRFLVVIILHLCRNH